MNLLDQLSPRHNESRAMHTNLPSMPKSRHVEFLGKELAEIWDQGTTLIAKRNQAFTDHSKALAALEQAEAADTETLAQALLADKPEPEPTAGRGALDRIADLRRRAEATDRAAFLSRQKFHDGLRSLPAEHRTTVIAKLEQEAAQAAKKARQLYQQAEDAKQESAALRECSLWFDVCPERPVMIRRAHDFQEMAVGRQRWLKDLDSIAKPRPTHLEQDDDDEGDL